MTASTIRRRLFDYLENADDKKIKAIYTMVEDEIENHEHDWDDALKQELDARYEEYKAGKAKLIHAEDSKRLVRSILENASKK